MEFLHFLGTISTTGWVIFYIIGIVLTFAFFALFGKRIGIDYDAPKTYVTFDDWGSNAEAFVAFAIFWPPVVLFGAVFAFFAGLVAFAGIFVK